MEGIFQHLPQPLRSVLDHTPLPEIILNRQRTHGLCCTHVRYPSFSELATPNVHIAGIRINIGRASVHNPLEFISALTVIDLQSGVRRAVPLPGDDHVTSPTWSPDGKRFSFLSADAYGWRPYICGIDDSEPSRIPDVLVNNVFGGRYGEYAAHWCANGRLLVLKTRVVSPGSSSTHVPAGPFIQDSVADSPYRWMYQHLLRSARDEAAFDHFGSCGIVTIDALTGTPTAFQPAGVVDEVIASPSGEYLLFGEFRKPYLSSVPPAFFGKSIKLMHRDGISILIAENPPQMQASPYTVPLGLRLFGWHPQQKHTIVGVEALDGGDMRTTSRWRDRIVMRDIRHESVPREVYRSCNRILSLMFIEGASRLLVTESRSEGNWAIASVDIDTTGRKSAYCALCTSDTRVSRITPMMTVDACGFTCVRLYQGRLVVKGIERTSDGERQFLATMDIASGDSDRLFTTDAHAHEEIAEVLDPVCMSLLIRRQTDSTAPHYCRCPNALSYPTKRQTLLRSPTPPAALRSIKKIVLRYTRQDGVPLSLTAVLPRGRGPFPTIITAYPRQCSIAVVTGTAPAPCPYTFIYPEYTSPTFLALAGYAVLEVSMPIVINVNDSTTAFRQQAMDNITAAIAAAVKAEIADPTRLGIIGHSYGAFLVGVLLCGTTVFRAGVACSGVYNRTLTPFGFQRERRTLWQSLNLYLDLSPVLKADSASAPLLLIHGAADDNPHTLPSQSEHMYRALCANGKVSRLVMLPEEGHTYCSREAVEHVLWETKRWFDAFLT